MKILIVEKDATIASLTAEALTYLGHEVLGPTLSSIEAIGVSATEPADVAVVEIDLASRNDGLELAMVLRDRFGIPCIFVSGRPLDAGSSWQGGTAFLPKPFSVTDLAASVLFVRNLADGGETQGVPTGLIVLGAKHRLESPFQINWIPLE